MSSMLYKHELLTELTYLTDRRSAVASYVCALVIILLLKLLVCSEVVARSCVHL